MNIVVLEYRPEDRARWEDLVAASNNGTLFHSQTFLDYHGERFAAGPGPAPRFRHLLFYGGEPSARSLLAVLPLGLEEAGGKRLARSPLGASFGGLVTAGVGHALYRDLVDALLGWAREAGVDALRLTPAPLCYHQRPDQAQDFALAKAGFRLEARELTHVVDLRHAAGEGLEAGYTYACDKQVRKAGRQGVAIRETRDWEAFHPILEADRARHGARPTHSLEDLRRLDSLVPGRLALFGAYRDGDDALLGGLLLFLAGPRAALNFYTAQVPEAARLGVANALDHASLGWAMARGMHYYDFGTSSLGMEANAGLSAFKEAFGAAPLLRDTWVWEREGR